MIFRQNAFFRSPVMASPIVRAHQLQELIPGVRPDWMLIMMKVFGDSVEKNVLLILMTVLMSFFLDEDFPSTVKPVYNGHPWDLKNVVVMLRIL